MARKHGAQGPVSVDPAPRATGLTQPSVSTATDAPVSMAIFGLARVHKAVAEGYLARLGLHPSQNILLMQLWAEDGRSQKDLAAAVGLEASSVARALQRLESAGYVRRDISADDGRVTQVRLTADGADLRERTRSAWQTLEARTTEVLDKGEQQEFIRLAQKVAASLI